MAERRFMVVGVTDEVTSCDCCGKSGLRRTIALREVDTDEIVHYGTSCAGRATGVSLSGDARSAAETLRRVFEAREKKAKAIEEAKIQSLRYNKPMLVIRDRNGHYRTDSESAYYGRHVRSGGIVFRAVDGKSAW